jgi:hypothetical protein
MAIVSAYTLIRSISLFHFALAILLIRNPKMIADQNFVFVMGESLQLVSSSATQIQEMWTDV